MAATDGAARLADDDATAVAAAAAAAFDDGVYDSEDDERGLGGDGGGDGGDGGDTRDTASAAASASATAAFPVPPQPVAPLLTGRAMAPFYTSRPTERRPTASSTRRGGALHSASTSPSAATRGAAGGGGSPRGAASPLAAEAAAASAAAALAAACRAAGVGVATAGAAASVTASDIVFRGWGAGARLATTVRITNAAAMSQRFQLALVQRPPPAFALDAGEENRGSVAPGASFQVRIHFTAPPARAAGDDDSGLPPLCRLVAALRIVSECGAVDVPVVADPAAARLGAPPLVDFGSVALLAPAVRTFAVTNSGAVPLAVHAEVLQAGVAEFFVAAANGATAAATARGDDAPPAPAKQLRFVVPPGGATPLTVTYIPYRMHSQAVELALRPAVAGPRPGSAGHVAAAWPQPPPPARVTLLGTACAGDDADKAALKDAAAAARATAQRRARPSRWADRDPGLVIVDVRLAAFKAAREAQLLAVLAARAAGVADGGDADDAAAVARGALVGDAPARFAHHGVVADGGSAAGAAPNRVRGTRPAAFDADAMLTHGGLRIPADMSSHAAVAFVLTQATPGSPAAVSRGRLKPRDVAAAVARKRQQHAALLAAAHAADAAAVDGSDSDAGGGDAGGGGGATGRATGPAMNDPFSLSTADVSSLLARERRAAGGTLGGTLGGSRSLSPTKAGAPPVGKSAFAATLAQPVLLTSLLQASWLFPFLVAKPAGVSDPRGAKVTLPPTSSARALAAFCAATTAALEATPDAAVPATGTLVDDLVAAALAAHYDDRAGAAGADGGSAAAALARLQAWLLRSTAATGIKNDVDAASGIDALALRRMTYRHLCDAVAAEEAHRDYSTAPVRGEVALPAATLAALGAARAALAATEAAVVARLLRLQRATTGVRPDGKVAAPAADGAAFSAFLLAHPTLRTAVVPSAVPPLPLAPAAAASAAAAVPSVAAWALPLPPVTYDAAQANDWHAATDGTAAFKAVVTRAVVAARVQRRLATLRARMGEAAALLRTTAAAAGPDDPAAAGGTRRSMRGPASVASRSIGGGTTASEAFAAGPGGSLAAHLTKAARQSARRARDSWVLEDAAADGGGGGGTRGGRSASPGAAAERDSGAARVAEALAHLVPAGKRSRLALVPNPRPDDFAAAGAKGRVRQLAVVRATLPTTDDVEALLPGDVPRSAAAPPAAAGKWAPASTPFPLPAAFLTTAALAVDGADDPLGAPYWAAQLAPSLLELTPVPLPVVPAECPPACASQPLRECRLYENAASGGVGGGVAAASAAVTTPEVDAAVAAAMAVVTGDGAAGAAASLPRSGQLPASWPLCVPTAGGIGAAVLWTAALQGGGGSLRAKPPGVLQYNVRGGDCAVAVPPTYATAPAAAALGAATVVPTVTLFGSGVQGVTGMPLEGDASCVLDAARALTEPYTTLPPPAPSALLPLDRSLPGILAGLPPALAHGIASGELARKLAAATAAATAAAPPTAAAAAAARTATSVPPATRGRGATSGGSMVGARSASASQLLRPVSASSRVSASGGGGGGGPTADEARDVLPRAFAHDATPDAATDINGVFLTQGARLAALPGHSSLWAAEAPGWPRALDGGASGVPPARAAQVARPTGARPILDAASVLLVPRATDAAAAAAAGAGGSADDTAELPRLATDVTPYERRLFNYAPHAWAPAGDAGGSVTRRWPPWGAAGAGAAVRIPPLLTAPLPTHQLSDDSESEPDDDAGAGSGSDAGAHHTHHAHRAHRPRTAVPTMAEAIAAFMPGALGRAAAASLAAAGVDAAGTAPTPAGGAPTLVTALEAQSAAAEWAAAKAAAATAAAQALRQALCTPLPAAAVGGAAARAVVAAGASPAGAAAAAAAAYVMDARGRAADNGSIASAVGVLPLRLRLDAR